MAQEVIELSDPDAIQHMDHLAVADPEAAHRMSGQLAGAAPKRYIDSLEQAVEEVVAALSVEITFGRRFAEGLGCMLANGNRENLARYRRLVKEAAESGPARAALFARHLATVLACNHNRLAERFEATTRVMLQKGNYTLKAPLETLSRLIEAGEIESALAFLDLLHTTYSLETSYNRTVYLTHTLPRAVDGFDPRKRLRQIRGLDKVIRENEHLADDYLQGLGAGLHLLSATALEDFLDQAIQRHRRDPEQGARFLSLASHRAMEICGALQVAVPLAQMRSTMERYLQARIGRVIPIRPFSSFPSPQKDTTTSTPLAACDGQAIYLPDELEVLDHKNENAGLYKLLVRLEAGAMEFGTFELDARKALNTCNREKKPDVPAARKGQTDLELFLAAFQQPDLALDLFTLFEHARIADRTNRRYPGLYRRMRAACADREMQRRSGCSTGGTLWPIYHHLVLGRPLAGDPALTALGRAMAEKFDPASAGACGVEDIAGLAMDFYPKLCAYVDDNAAGTFQPLQLPFGRRFEPSGFMPVDSVYRRLAVDIRDQLADKNLCVYRADVQRLLEEQAGHICLQDIQALLVNPKTASEPEDLAWLDLESLVCRHGLTLPADDDDPANAYRYREWDWCMGDYLPDHTRVRECRVDGRDSTFYGQTLEDFNGLVKRIRYAFELLRPEEMTILRQWPEGDAFDYRALLDWALDRKAGLMPSDRLFIKRMKRVRDVSVMLLVDLSRSTANAVDESGIRVLDVEKQAIVLLCEALTVIGDRFAIAGFSGTGPLGVDYYRIKDLGEDFDEAVKRRIGGMAPQRSTRMGAAIRHATAQLAPVPSRVRLIMILGDGFPNDLEYKGAYAVEDTRRAVMEARAEAVHVKAITVNVSDNGMLDRLYGAAHHTLIGNIRDLPDRLVRVYSALTRH
jgi:hypothetical protein